MALTWLSFDLATGEVLADLPGLIADYPLRRTIGRYESATAHLPYKGAPSDWQDVVREGGCVLGAYDDDDPAQLIQWAGIVVAQTRNTGTAAVDLSLATGEAYFDRRYVGDATYVGIGQHALVADLVARFVSTAGADPGIPITTRFDTAGTPRDRAYLDVDSSTVYTRLTQLMATQGGPEFTVEWEWADDREHIFPVLRVAARLGQPVAAGLAANATFDYPGCITEAEQIRDYSAGKGANKVTAFSSGEGDATPTSGPVYAADFQRRPTFEFRWTPSTSITNTGTLRDYALQAVALLAPGSRTLTLTAELAGGTPRLGDDWRLGDDVGYVLGGLDDDGADLAPQWPGGVAGTGRVIAYEVAETTITPILAEAEVYTDNESEAAA